MRSCTLLLVAAFASGADPSAPHPHQGLLGKYERLPPSKIGMGKLDVETEALRQGSPVLKLIQSPGGWTRSVSVQDVHAPESVVWSAINDLPRYPKMIEGVIACDVYSKKNEGGAIVKSASAPQRACLVLTLSLNDLDLSLSVSQSLTLSPSHSLTLIGVLYFAPAARCYAQVTCATYKLKAAGFAMEYYMKHFFEPKKHSMTFHLDYERLSDVADSVGYWYVEDLKDGWCRVYYSTDTKLPRFIPGFAKDAIVNMAAKRSTSWVDVRCNELTGNSNGAGKSGRKWLPTRKQLAAMLALAYGWQQGVLPAVKLPFLPFALPKLPFALPRLPKLPLLPSKLAVG